MCNYCIIHNLEINIRENQKGQSRDTGNNGHKTEDEGKTNKNTTQKATKTSNTNP